MADFSRSDHLDECLGVWACFGAADEHLFLSLADYREAFPPTPLFCFPLWSDAPPTWHAVFSSPCCQVVGQADREEHPSVWHAGGSGQSGSSDYFEWREKRLGIQQGLGEGLPGKCKTHRLQNTETRSWFIKRNVTEELAGCHSSSVRISPNSHFHPNTDRGGAWVDLGWFWRFMVILIGASMRNCVLFHYCIALYVSALECSACS